MSQCKDTGVKKRVVEAAVGKVVKAFSIVWIEHDKMTNIIILCIVIGSTIVTIADILIM